MPNASPLRTDYAFICKYQFIKIKSVVILAENLNIVFIEDPITQRKKLIEKKVVRAFSSIILNIHYKFN